MKLSFLFIRLLKIRLFKEFLVQWQRAVGFFADHLVVQASLSNENWRLQI